MPEPYEIRPLKVGTDEYRAELVLRDQILRKPLGLSIYDGLTDESAEHHLGCFLGHRLVGVLILSSMTGGEIRMRQVAVAAAFQGSGVGTRLVRYAEDYAQSLGCSKIRLHARKTATGFYEKIGYRKVGTEFLEVGIAHYEMVKDLSSCAEDGCLRF